ncbi:MAG: YHYH domain-containing protein [Comamonadaceae bacterium]|nr:MAG: YHYH domain-containing protein [Comamonadaceae bacterium]
MKTILGVALFLAVSLAFAHSGGTDKNGCHHNRKTGDYHCH